MPCDNEAYHKDSKTIVTVGETFAGLKDATETVEINGRMVTRPVAMRRTEKEVPYREWSGRCPICFPR